MAVIAKLLILIVMATSSVYIFESGNPQPSDLVAVLFIIFITIWGMAICRWEIPSRGFPVWHLFLVVWVAAINMAWAIVLSSDSFIRPVFFYTYNFLVVVAIVMCLRHITKFQEWLAFSIAVGLVVSGIGAIYSLGTHIRPTGFFNNPNQLAYFSLLGMSALLISSKFSFRGSVVYYLALMSATISLFAAASLAAWGGLAMLASAVVLNAFSRKGRGIIIVCVSIALLGVVVQGVDIYSDGAISNTVEVRLNRADSKLEGMYEGRKYDRITHNIEYALLGAGEAEYEKRFYPHASTEIHSSFGTMLFAYGVVGLLLFCALIFSALRNAPLPVWLAVSAPLVYSLTHMGLRTTLFWVLLAMVWDRYQCSRSTQKLRARSSRRHQVDEHTVPGKI